MTTPEVQSVMQLGSLADWVAGISTLFAVLVALFKDEISRWWRQPKLLTSIALAPPDCAKTTLHYINQHEIHTTGAVECYYLRLWVHNQGKIRAEKVQVYAEKLLKRSADQTFKAVENFLPMNLRWSHGQGEPEIFADGISAKMGKHCDLGHVTDPKMLAKLRESLTQVPSGETILALDLEVRPNTLSHLLEPGTYHLLLRVAAANALPVSVKLEITITGKWFSDEKVMFREGLGVRVL